MRRAISIAVLQSCCLLLIAIQAAAQDGDAGGDLSSLPDNELRAMEASLKLEIKETDAALKSLHEDTRLLKEEKEAIDTEADRLVATRQWEDEEKSRRDKELEIAKVEVSLKHAAISKLTSRVAALRDQIGTLEQTLTELIRLKNETEQRYQDPTLADVLDSRSQEWSELTRNLYNKTMINIVPVFSKVSGVARKYRRRVSRTSRALELLVSLLVYGFVIFAGYIMHSIYSKVHVKLTVNSLLFIGDSFCACFWLVILFCFVIQFRDPLSVVQERSAGAFFALQLIAITVYVAFVFLRILVLASKMTVGALGETLAVVIVGQHYYVRVWQPAILDELPRGTIFYYLCYAALFSAFAQTRAGSLAALHKPMMSNGAPLHTLHRGMTSTRMSRGGAVHKTPTYAPDDMAYMSGAALTAAAEKLQPQPAVN
jgi:hypothetical protein